MFPPTHTYLYEYFISILSLEGEITAHEDVEQNTEGPDVALIVVLTFQNLGCHVIWCTSYALQLLIWAFCSLGEAKVDQLDFTFLGQHYIFWFDVSMYDSL